MRTSRRPRAGRGEQVGGEAVGVGPRRLDVVEAGGERRRLGRRRSRSAGAARRRPPRAGRRGWSGSSRRCADVGDVHGDGGGHGWGFPSEVGEAGLERGAGLVQAGLDGAGGDAEARGDLGVGEVGEVEQRDGVALAGREGGDRGEHARAVRAVGRRRRGSAASSGSGGGLRRRAPGEVVADAAQPGAEGAVVAQGREAGEGLQHRLLRPRRARAAGRSAAAPAGGAPRGAERVRGRPRGRRRRARRRAAGHT